MQYVLKSYSRDSERENLMSKQTYKTHNIKLEVNGAMKQSVNIRIFTLREGGLWHGKPWYGQQIWCLLLRLGSVEKIKRFHVKFDKM